MEILTRDGLKKELLDFTEHSMRKELANIRSALKQDLQEELQKLIRVLHVWGSASQATWAGDNAASAQDPLTPKKGPVFQAVRSGDEPVYPENSVMASSSRQWAKSRQSRRHLRGFKAIEMLQSRNSRHTSPTSRIPSIRASSVGSRVSHYSVAQLLSRRTSRSDVGPSVRDVAELKEVLAYRRRWLPRSWSEMRRECLRLVGNIYFDYAVGFLVFVNAISIGIQTDYLARHHTVDAPLAFWVCDAVFCAAFGLEIAVRLTADGVAFFYGRGWKWNIFDLTVTALQLFEVISEAGSSSRVLPIQLSMARMVRILRYIRLIRVIRIVRLITELRTLVTSITSSMRCFFWTLVLLGIMIYMASVGFTQFVTDYLWDPDGKHDSVRLPEFYGSLGRSTLTLFQSITGGVDWYMAMDPLYEEVSWLTGPLFCIYVSFALFAMLNVVTGVFVEVSLKNAKEDKENFMITNLQEMYASEKGDLEGSMSWQDFERLLGRPGFQNYFRAIDIDLSEAKGVFTLLDIDRSGMIDIDEFLNGCLRLHGPAKAVDLAVLRHEVGCILSELSQFLQTPHSARRDFCSESSVSSVRTDTNRSPVNSQPLQPPLQPPQQAQQAQQQQPTLPQPQREHQHQHQQHQQHQHPQPHHHHHHHQQINDWAAATDGRPSFTATASLRSDRSHDRPPRRSCNSAASPSPSPSAASAAPLPSALLPPPTSLAGTVHFSPFVPGEAPVEVD